ncbi:MAG: stalk domain-containing protein [Tumebacillaceae bacterium]
MKKAWLSVCAAFALLTAGPLASTAHALPMTLGEAQSITVQLDGYPLPLSPEPMQYKERTMVPFRQLADALGIQVDWQADTSTVIATAPDLDLRLQLGNSTALVNGQPVALDAEPVLLDDRTFIPLRFFSEHAGAKVGWEEATRTVSMQSPQRDMQAMVFYGLGSYDKRGYLPQFDQTAFTWSILDEQGRFSTTQSEYSWPAEGADELLSEVKQAQVGSSLMVFSANQKGEITKLLGDEQLQDTFIRDLTAKLDQRQLDGAIFDLESLAPDSAQAYAAFVQRAATALHAAGKKLQVVVHPLNGASVFQGYDYKALGAAADALYVMAYSYVDDKEPQPLAKVDEALRMALEQVEPSKLMLGINAVSETPETVKEKIGLAKRYRLQGVGFWILVAFDEAFMQAIDDSLILHDESK